MKIEQVMTRPVITCRPSDTLNVAAGLMWEHDCGALPVVDDKGAIVGMITDRDICMAAYTAGRDLHSVSVGTGMAKVVLSCLPGDELSDAVETMASGRVRRLPVLDAQRRPIGMISMNDVVRLGARLDKRAGVVAQTTLAAICEPRRKPLSKVA